MKIFIDTNIFLDIVFEREYAQEGLMIFKAVKNHIFDAFIADITIVNIDYVSKKVNSDIRPYLQAIENNFTILGADNILISEALHIDNNDLEDNLQYLLAMKSSCEYIITNDKSFYQGKIKTINSNAFVEQFLIA